MTTSPAAPSAPSVAADSGLPPAGTGRARIAAQFIGMGLVWGASFLFIKVALEGASFGQVAWSRIVLGGVTLAIIALAMRIRLPRQPRLWGHFLIVGVTFTVIPHLLFAWAEQSISSSLASIYNAVTPLTTALMAVLLFRIERLNAGQVLGLATGFAGVVVIAAPWNIEGLLTSWQGQLACLGAVTCYGFAMGYLKRFVAPYKVPAVTSSFMYIALGAIVMLLLTPVVAWQPVRLDFWIVSSLIILGALGTGVAYIWNMNVLAAWGPTATSSVTYLTPVVGVVLGVIVLSERISVNEPIGAALVLLGVLLTQQRIRIPSRSRQRR